MRLIDADELLKHKGNCYDINGHLLYAVGTGNIMAAKTIDPVKHGRWVEHAWEWHKCSACGATATNDDEGYEYLTPYCPNCGASMDGGE